MRCIEILKSIHLAILRMAKQVGLLAKFVMNTASRRREQVLSDELEVERLDRIRNPEKYRGK